MKLYFSPGACSLAPHILLRETGARFELAKVDTASHVTAAGDDFYAVNPKGQVPLLELADGERLSEGAIIAQYISESAVGSRLLPATGMARYRVLEWQNYVASELHKSYTPLFNPALAADAKQTLKAGLRRKYEWLDSRLGNAYLTGDDFTVADAYLFVVSQWAKYVDLDLSDLSNLQAYLGRVASRPAVREAMQAEGLLA